MVLRRVATMLVLAAAAGPAVRPVYVAGKDGASVPKLLHSPRSPEPPDWGDLRIDARFRYATTIEQDGAVGDVQLDSCKTRRCGLPEYADGPAELCSRLDRDLRPSVMKYRYEPAKKDGLPVAVSFQLEVKLSFCRGRD